MEVLWVAMCGAGNLHVDVIRFQDLPGGVVGSSCLLSLRKRTMHRLLSALNGKCTHQRGANVFLLSPRIRCKASAALESLS